MKLSEKRPDNPKVNYIDETSWFTHGMLKWLWTMVNTKVAYFKIHPRRSKKALAALIDDWQGILVSDGFTVYQKWVRAQTNLPGSSDSNGQGLVTKKRIHKLLTSA